MRVLTQKTNKEYTKAFQKIRQRRNTISNHKNGNIVQINQQKIEHETSKARRKTQQFRQAQKQRHSFGDCFVKTTKKYTGKKHNTKSKHYYKN